jgi:hypothetical protein
MQRAFQIGVILSAILLILQGGVLVWALSPQAQDDWAVTEGLYVSLWGDRKSREDQEGVGPLLLYNHEILRDGWQELASKTALPSEIGAVGLYRWRLPLTANFSLWAATVSLWYPLAFCAVLPAVATVRWTIRKRCQFSLRALLALMLLVAFFLGSWSLTAHVGTASVLDAEHAAYLLEGSTRVDLDPLEYGLDRDWPDHRDWHYLGDASSPFPFLVCYKEAYGRSPWEWSDEQWGGRSHKVSLWVFGLKIPLDYWTRFGTQFV